MTAWAYDVVKVWAGTIQLAKDDCTGPDDARDLNQLGREGWEVVQLLPSPRNPNIVHAYIRRLR